MPAARRASSTCAATPAGFAVAAARSSGGETVGVDLDADALDLARHNANLNQVRVRFVQADLFTWLRNILPLGERFDIVVLDPSKQTRDREEIGLALRRYLDMNRLAFQAVAADGFLLSCSCTGLVSEADFLDTLRRAARQASREAQVVRLAGAAPDHPFLLHAPEGRYLKAVLCRVW